MKRHPIDLVSLTAGILVVGTAVILMGPDADVRSLWQFAPLGLVALGLALLASAVTRARRDAGVPASAGADDPSPRRADDLTEEELIRDSLGHFGSDPADTGLLFDPAATESVHTRTPDARETGDTGKTEDTDDSTDDGATEHADTERLSPRADTSPPQSSAEDDDR